MKREPYIYCIIRLNSKYYHRINEDLREYGYAGIKAIIPTVSILKKTTKGKNTYAEVPLLFNYGFVKMRSFMAFDRNLLRDIKKNIPGIASWVLSPESLHPTKKRRRVDNAEDFDDFSIVADITRDQLKYYQRAAKKNRIYSQEDVFKLKEGEYITLRGYPFEGVSATVTSINRVSKMVGVSIESDLSKIEVKLPFDNIFYSIYHAYDENLLYTTDFEVDLNSVVDSEGDILSDKQY